MGWEFEIPSYKYDGMFRPLEDLLKKLPEPPAKGKDGAKGKKSATPPGAMSPDAMVPQMSPVPAR
jgi:hypothetical protein